MADSITSKKILIEIEAQTESLQNSIAVANDAIGRLTKSQQQLTDSGKQNNRQFKDNAAMIDLWQSRLTNATAQVNANAQAIKLSTGSLEQNKEMVADLTAEKQKLSIGFADNSAKAEELQTKINALNTTIQKQEQIMNSARERAEIFGTAFKNVKSGVDGLSTVSDILGNKLGSAAQSFEPFKTNMQTAVKVIGPLKGVLSAANQAYAKFRSGMASGQGAFTAFKNNSAGTKLFFDTLKGGADKGKAALSSFKTGLTAFKKGVSEGNGVFASFSNGIKEGKSAFSGLTGGVNMGSTSFKMLKTAIAETGIGLLVIVVATVIEKLQECKPVMDMVNAAMSALGAATRVVIDAVKNLFSSLSNIGNFLAHPIESITNLGKAMAKAAVEAYNLAQAQERLKTAMSAIEVENAGLKENIDLLKEKSKDGKLSVQQRLDNLKKASDAEDKYFKANKRLTDQQRANAIEDARLKQGLSDKEIAALKERGTQYAQELLNEGKITQEQFDAIKKADLDIITLRKEHNESSKELLDEQQNIADEAEAKKKEKEEQRQQRAAAAKLKNEQDKAKANQDKEKIDADTREAVEEAKEAQARIEEAALTGKARELKEINENYRQQLSKYQDFLNEYDKMNAADKAANQKKKEAYEDAKSKIDKQVENDKEQLEAKYAKETEQKALDERKKLNEQLLEIDKKAIEGAASPKAKLEAQKKEITDEYKFKLEQAENNLTATIQLAVEEKKALSKLDDDYQKEKAEKEKKRRDELKKEGLKDAKEVADQALSLLSSSIKQESDAKVASLEKDKAAELHNASLTSGQKLAIEQKYKKEEGQIKAKAFKEEQKLSIAQALINGAVAVTKVSAQEGALAVLEIGVIVAETAVQVAKIASQKPPAYASGGLHYMSDGRGGVLPGYSKTDNTNAYLRSGEGVVVSEAMRVPWARNLVSAINVGFGGRDFSMANPGRGYAIGGIFTDGGDANRYYNQPVHDQKNLANTIAYQMINNFPPVYVDVKDINNQQNILAQTINRVNL